MKSQQVTDWGIDWHTQVPDLQVASPSTSNPQKVPIEGDILNWPLQCFWQIKRGTNPRKFSSVKKRAEETYILWGLPVDGDSPSPKSDSNTGAGPSSPGVMIFSRLIQQREVADPVQEESICWNGARNPKSQIKMTPELSKHSSLSMIPMYYTSSVVEG